MDTISIVSFTCNTFHQFGQSFDHYEILVTFFTILWQAFKCFRQFFEKYLNIFWIVSWFMNGPVPSLMARFNWAHIGSCWGHTSSGQQAIVIGQVNWALSLVPIFSLHNFSQNWTLPEFINTLRAVGGVNQSRHIWTVWGPTFANIGMPVKFAAWSIEVRYDSTVV